MIEGLAYLEKYLIAINSFQSFIDTGSYLICKADLGLNLGRPPINILNLALHNLIFKLKAFFVHRLINLILDIILKWQLFHLSRRRVWLIV